MTSGVFDLEAIWLANRAYLVDLAFGIVRDIGAAEDAVQESFARLATTRTEVIEDPRGWLIVVTSRICLDYVKSAGARRVRPHDAESLERTEANLRGEESPLVDPADRITLDDEVRLALLVVLQRLTPAERVAFVLHDVFQMPFETVALTMSRPIASCRQLAHRARTKLGSVQADQDRDFDAGQHREIVRGFIDACSGGSLSELVSLLAPDVWGDIDLGPHDVRSGRVERGVEKVSANLVRFFRTSTLVSAPTLGHIVLFAFVERSLWAVIELDTAHGRIQQIHVIADPDKIGFLAGQLAEAR